MELKDTYFEKRLNGIKKFLLSDMELSAGEMTLVVAKTKIQRLQKDPIAREKVRAALLSQMSSMLEEINIVFSEARLAVKKAKVPSGEQPYHDLVLILDNLEKIQRFENKAEGIESQRELFIERAPQLASLEVHVIYTVPLRLARADGPQLKQRYGAEPLVLPMVKVIQRGNRRSYEKGVEFLKSILQKRLGTHRLDEVFSPDALDFLLTYSGGHIRNLMTFVQSACAYADAIPIPVEAAHRAIQQTVRAYSTAIPETHWQKLAELDRSEAQQIPNGDNDYLAMLENLSVLEYINGGEEHNAFTPAEPWYAVNPIVRELQKFKAAEVLLAKVATP